MKKNKKFLVIAATLLAFALGAAIVSQTTLGLTNVNSVHASECSHHSGYHYLAKEATIDDSGWVEFWACCICGHQYIGEAPQGDWVTQDPSHMIGGVQQGHIAYVPPLSEGGGDGDYWGKDPF